MNQYKFDINNEESRRLRLAVKQNGYAIEYINNPSEELKRLAVQQYGYAIEYINNPSEELKRLAIQQNGYAIKYIDNPSEELQEFLCSQHEMFARHTIEYAIQYSNGLILTDNELYILCKKIFNEIDDHSFYCKKDEDIKLFHNQDDVIFHKMEHGCEIFSIELYKQYLNKKVLTQRI